MATEARLVVDKMFDVFSKGDVDAIVALFSDDAVLTHHGTQVMPSAKFKGKDGARMFFEFNVNALEVVYFNKNEYIESGDEVIVLGNEHFISRQDGKHLKNEWVQIYAVRNGLITRMEEFATSATQDQYGGNYYAK